MSEYAPVAIRRVAVDEIRALRHQVLRGPSLPLSESVYEQDGLNQTRHYAAFVDDVVVACATAFPESLDGLPAWRLRGMAVAQAHQRQGVGGQVLSTVVLDIRQIGGTVMWCHARIDALKFYRQHGFVPRNTPFTTGQGIPHDVAVLPLV